MKTLRGCPRSCPWWWSRTGPRGPLTLPVLPSLQAASLPPSQPPPPTHKQFLLASGSEHSWSLTTSSPPSLSPRWLPGLPHWPPTAFLVPVMSPLHTAGVVILLKQVITYTRKESKKRTNTCICVTGSLCWAPETNTLSINWTPISFFF